MAETTIGISLKLREELIKRKLIELDSYENVIWRMIENEDSGDQ